MDQAIIDETTSTPCFADRAPPDSWLHYKLLETLGQATGYELGSDQARTILSCHNSCWVFDRTTHLLFHVRSNHNLVASLFYALHKGIDEVDIEDMSEAYVQDLMGFWLSSVSENRVVWTGPNLKKTAREQIAFRDFNFKEM